MSGYWTDTAAIHIDGIIKAARAEGVTDIKVILKRLDDSYPFGERAYWPYKCWLRVRKAAIRHLNGEPAEVDVTAARKSERVFVRVQHAAESAALKPVAALDDWLKRVNPLA